MDVLIAEGIGVGVLEITFIIFMIFKIIKEAKQ
jgi:hypothetical protein